MYFLWPVHHAGHVLTTGETKCEIFYYRKADVPKDQDPAKVFTFKEPVRREVLNINKEDIVMKLQLKEVCKSVVQFVNTLKDIIIR